MRLTNKLLTGVKLLIRLCYGKYYRDELNYFSCHSEIPLDFKSYVIFFVLGQVWFCLFLIKDDIIVFHLYF